jgi:DtxR family Mn-dependent transcriptional regulator
MANETRERYVETINELQDDNERVHNRDIARALGVREASVTEMLQKLDEENFVDYVPYHGVLLTVAGRKLAGELTKKHQILAELFKLLGVNQKSAEKNACRIEHIITSDTMDQIEKFVWFVSEAPDRPPCLKHFYHFLKTGKYKCFEENSNK